MVSMGSMHTSGATENKEHTCITKGHGPPKCKCDFIYWYRCNRVDCDQEYNGKSAITFGERYKKHPHQYIAIIPPLDTKPLWVTSVGRRYGFARMIKESIYLRVNNPTLNRNTGKYNISHIWDEVLVNIPELQNKHKQEHQYQPMHTTSV